MEGFVRLGLDLQIKLCNWPGRNIVEIVVGVVLLGLVFFFIEYNEHLARSSVMINK